MPIYKYRAADSQGNITNGAFSAKNAEEAEKMIRSNKQIPLEIFEANASVSSRSISFNKKVSIKDLSVLCNQLNTLLKSGVTITQCVDIFRTQSENKKLMESFNQVYKDLQTGLLLSEALRKHKKIFPGFMVNMIASGEASGNLEVVANRLSVHYEKEYKIRSKIQGAMIYPVLLSIVSIVVVMALVTFVMPTFFTLFAKAGNELPLPTRILLYVSDFLTNRWYIAVFAMAVLAVAVRTILKSSGGKLAKDRLMLRIPVIKKVIVNMSASRFARTLSTLLTSGIPLLQALEVTAGVIGNKVYENMLVQAEEDVKKGSDLSTPIEVSGLFPAILCNMVRIGEQSGLLDESLERAADFYDNEVDDAVSKLSSVLEPVMIVIMAVLVGAVVIAIAMPMMQMYNNLDLS